jgi:Ring finger domain
MSQIENVECPICFDTIGVQNNVTTECGHKFHASCLMKNVSVNGFGCPCCRAVMATKNRPHSRYRNNYDNDEDYNHYNPHYYDVDENEEGEIDEDDEDETSTLLDDIPEEERFSDFALRGLRLLTSLLEGQEQELEDVNAENAELLQISEDEDAIIAPSLEYVACALEEEGITYKKLVAWLLMDHEEYSDREEEYENFAGDIWGKLRIIISNFRNDDDYEVADEVAIDEVATEVAAEVASDAAEVASDAAEVAAEEEHQEETSYIQEEAVEEKQTKSEEERRSPLEIWGVWKEREMLQFIVDYQAQPKTRIQDLIQNLETLVN